MHSNPRRCASATEAYHHHVGRYGAQLAAGLIDLAGIRRGTACSTSAADRGRSPRALADRVGAVNMAGLIRRQISSSACRARVPDADAHVAAAKRLPFRTDG
jgi:hypothetical protein